MLYIKEWEEDRERDREMRAKTYSLIEPQKMFHSNRGKCKHILSKFALHGLIAFLNIYVTMRYLFSIIRRAN